MEDLIASVRSAVETHAAAAATSEAVAGVLEPYLNEPALLTDAQRAPDEEAYRQHVVHVEPGGSFSVVSLVWLPDQVTPIHDHVSWCVVGVYEGRENEFRFELADAPDESHLVPAGHSINERGSVAALTPPGDIHQVRNSGSGTAISMHIYGADIGALGSSIRRSYDLPIRDTA